MLGYQRAKYLIILCMERSGSTLLNLMLGRHSRIIAPPELHLLRFDSYEEWRHKYPIALESFNWLVNALGLSNELKDVFPDLDNISPVELYKWISNRTKEYSWIIDKTPAYARHHQTLKRIENLNPHYIWLIRHPLGITASRLDLFRIKAEKSAETISGLAPRLKFVVARVRDEIYSWTGKDVRDQLANWRDVNSTIHDFLIRISPTRQETIYYEELVRSPEIVIRQICRFIALEFEPRMLSPVEDTPTPLRWGIGDEKALKRQIIDPTSAEKWKETFSPKLLDYKTRNLMRKFDIE